MYKHLLGQLHQKQRLQETEQMDEMPGSGLGTALQPLEMIAKRKMLHKLLNIMENTTLFHHFRVFSWGLCKEDVNVFSFTFPFDIMQNLPHHSQLTYLFKNISSTEFSY